MNQNEPKRHHYIPQFILRNFLAENGLLYYWDNENKTLTQRSTKSIFMNISMYRSEEINSDNPVEIENNLSKFEQEISNIFRRINTLSEITLTRKELESLRIFLSLLSFRSDLRMNQYKNKKFNESTEELLKIFKGEQDFELFWKKEINDLAKCRTFEDINLLENVDPIIKMDFQNDLTGYYMTIIEARGQDFIISDVYPTLEIFPLKEGINIHLHVMFPISPNRAILLNHIMFKKQLLSKKDDLLNIMTSFSQIKNNSLKEPKPHYIKGPAWHMPDDVFTYKPVKIYEKEVTYINTLFLNETRKGFAFKEKNRITNSIIEYTSTNQEYNKNNLDHLLEIMNSDKEVQ